MDARASDEVRALLRPLDMVVFLEEARLSNRNLLAETLRRWSDEEELDLILTIGGTLPAPGPSSEECVPEATLDVLDRLAPGLSEAMRAEVSIDNPLALLDRGVAGIRSRTLIVNLPGGGAASLFLSVIPDVLIAAVAHLQGDPAAPRLGDLVTEKDNGGDHSGDQSISEESASTGLDFDEFAAFLRRPKVT